MNREEAINIVRNIYQTDKEKRALGFLIPELRENEDERIRNLIYCLIRDRSDNQKLLEHNGVSVDEALAYLEKQKKQLSLMGGNTDLYFDEWNQQQTKSPTKRQCFEEGMRYSQRLQKEQKPAEWSEEDERIFNELLDHCNTENATWYNFLKSIRPDSYKNCNSHWKPSEEQN